MTQKHNYHAVSRRTFKTISKLPNLPFARRPTGRRPSGTSSSTGSTRSSLTSSCSCAPAPGDGTPLVPAVHPRTHLRPLLHHILRGGREGEGRGPVHLQGVGLEQRRWGDGIVSAIKFSYNITTIQVSDDHNLIFASNGLFWDLEKCQKQKEVVFFVYSFASETKKHIGLMFNFFIFQARPPWCPLALWRPLPSSTSSTPASLTSGRRRPPLAKKGDRGGSARQNEWNTVPIHLMVQFPVCPMFKNVCSIYHERCIFIPSGKHELRFAVVVLNEKVYLLLLFFTNEWQPRFLYLESRRPRYE